MYEKCSSWAHLLEFRTFTPICWATAFFRSPLNIGLSQRAAQNYILILLPTSCFRSSVQRAGGRPPLHLPVRGINSRTFFPRVRSMFEILCALCICLSLIFTNTADPRWLVSSTGSYLWSVVIMTSVKLSWEKLVETARGKSVCSRHFIVGCRTHAMASLTLSKS